MLNIRLKSENIDYVDVSETLIPDYLKMINDRKIAKLLSAKVKTYSYDDEINWVNKKLNENAMIFSMIERKSNEFIGNIELMNSNGSSAEIGIVITEKFQGNHYGTESLKTIINHAFDDLKLTELYLIVHSHNIRAINLYKKLGFKEYKTEYNVARIDNQPVHDVFMILKK